MTSELTPRIAPATTRQKLRAILEAGKTVQVPSIYDGVTAAMGAAAGFSALSVTGNGISGSLLGRPDVGLITLAESAGVARNLARAVDVPLIFDADTGYGSALNVVRTVEEMEAAGIAAIKLEDQVTPKRCGVLDVPIPVVEEDEYIGKIEAAVWARTDPDFVLVARTDAKSTLGIDSAARRAARAIEAGADVAMVIGARTPEELERVAKVVQAPLALLVENSGPVADMPLEDIQSLGYTLAIYPGAVRYSMMGAAMRALEALREEGTTASFRHLMATPDDWNRLLGIDRQFALEQKYVRGNGSAAAS